jgi:uncharacterized protein YkwD
MLFFSLQKKWNLVAIGLMVCWLILPTSTLAQVEQVYSISEGEEKIGTYFHELLNAYRVKKKKKSVAWSTTLQKAASNHTQWMIDAKKLSHTEVKTRPSFTGKTHGERIRYVNQGKGSVSSAENIQYFTFTLKNTEAIMEAEAKQIAQIAFEEWRISKGHNENMLSDNLFHGVSFVYSKGYIWSTSVFSGSL